MCLCHLPRLRVAAPELRLQPPGLVLRQQLAPRQRQQPPGQVLRQLMAPSCKYSLLVLRLVLLVQFSSRSLRTSLPTSYRLPVKERSDWL